MDRIKDNDKFCWEDFLIEYEHYIRNVLRKRGLQDESGLNEVLQNIIINIFKKQETFTYDRSKGKFRSFLNCQITYAHLTHCGAVKKKNSREVSLDFIDELGSEADSEMVCKAQVSDEHDEQYKEEWAAHVKKQALKYLKNSSSPEKYETFFKYVIKEIPAREVAKEMGISVNEVYKIKNRLTAKLQGFEIEHESI